MQTRHVVTCFLESHRRILILRRSSKVGTYQGKWAAISGFIEKTPDEQSLIEIKEEAGLKETDLLFVRKGDPLEVPDENLKVNWVVHPYLFQVINPEKIKIDWEHLEFKWIYPSEIDLYETVPKLKEALEKVT